MLLAAVVGLEEVATRVGRTKPRMQIAAGGGCPLLIGLGAGVSKAIALTAVGNMAASVLVVEGLSWWACDQLPAPLTEARCLSCVLQVRENLSGLDYPLIWTADFILDVDETGGDAYRLGELNASCVGFTTHLELAELVADAIVSVVSSRKAPWMA